MSDIDKIQINDGTILNIKDSYARENLQNLSQDVNNLSTKIGSVASGSPAGVFNTLDDLTNSQNTDKNRIYVVQETGNWYFWNETAWQDGGTYQSIVIADNTITNFQTQFLRQGRNKLLALYTTGKDLTVEPLENGNISLKGIASASPLNFPISRFIIDKEDDYLFYKVLVKGISPSCYIYNEANSDTIVATISATTTNQTIHLTPGTYTLNAYFATGTTVDTEMYMQLQAITDINNSFTREYFKPSVENKFTNNISNEKYDMLTNMIFPIVGNNNYSCGEIDLVNHTLKLNSSFILFREPFYPNKDYPILNYAPISSQEAIELVPDTTKSGIYVCYMDYSKNIGVSHYSEFINNVENYIILLFYYWSSTANKITSYNSLGNNFNIKGNINPNANFNTLTYNAIGDSLTYGYLNSSTQMTTPYPKAVEEQLNLQTSYNNGLTGTTVADDRSVMQSYYPMSADERMTTYQNADIISVMGGTNDFSKNVTLGDITSNDAKTFYGGYKKLLNYLITNNPNSLIFTITPPWSQNEPTTTNKKGYSRQDITNAIKEVSSYFGVPCLDMNVLGQLGYVNKNTWTVDGTHFTQEYVSNIFSKKVANFIYNNIQELPA